MTTGNRSSNTKQRILFGIMTVLYWTSMYMYVPILSPYLSSLGLSLSITGIILGSYGFVQMLVRFPIGLWSDTIGRRKPFIVLGLAAGALSCLLFIIPGGYGWPLAGRVAAGVCASTWVAFTIMYASMFEPGESSTAMGQISAMTVTGQLAGMALSAPLADSVGWSVPFLVGTGAALVALPFVWSIREQPVSADERPPMSLQLLGNVVREPTLVRASILSILVHMMLFISMFGFTPLKAKELEADGWLLTAIVFAFMVPHALASLMMKKLSVKLGEWRLLQLSFLFGAAATIMISYSPSLGWLAATQAINGFMQGLILPMLLSLAIRDAHPRERATAMGFYQAVYSIGMFAGPFVAGWINDEWGINSGFWLGGLAGTAAAVLSLIWGIASHRQAKTAIRAE
ncbi:MFS transporter [Paenibacillus xylaniclasticus]|uniref:MFS transporter n=1 Tax=Paenibacillus xylaniclasticus TaxID=588083 RepID=UPI000FDC76A5|nr:MULTISPECIES: MFS transporter [Paenibacillus]GFN31806.1 putative MFS-type transporter YxlH [Paenibacillus curdlanolyticus]